jgi:hypothetical protein
LPLSPEMDIQIFPSRGRYLPDRSSAGDKRSFV